MSGSESKAPSSSEEGVGGGAFLRAPRQLLLARAAAMRRVPTQPEHLLWLALRNSQLAGHKFRRQATIGGRIVDFFCPAKGLIVEIDGESHERERDLQHDAVLQDRSGFVTLRFTNGEVMRHRDDVVRAMLLALEARADRWASAGLAAEAKEPEARHHPLTPSSEDEGK
jgi:very-short-patch-repair endonuclease